MTMIHWILLLVAAVLGAWLVLTPDDTRDVGISPPARELGERDGAPLEPPSDPRTASMLEGARPRADPVSRELGLESRVAALESRVADLADVLQTVVDGVANRGLLLPGSLILRDVQATANVLGLDETQRAQLERALQDATSQLEDLYGTSNGEGLTWNGVANRRVLVPSDGDAPAVMAGDAAGLRRFSESRVPGTQETFAQARRRLTHAWLMEFREVLRPGQQRLWDSVRADALVQASPGSAEEPPPDGPSDADRASKPGR